MEAGGILIFNLFKTAAAVVVCHTFCFAFTAHQEVSVRGRGLKGPAFMMGQWLYVTYGLCSMTVSVIQIAKSN
jgi:hypothetical protein